MKNFIPLTFTLFLLFTFFNCKKETSPPGRSTLKSNISFKYNGNLYTLTYVSEGAQEWGVDGNNLYIDRPDIFNGRIDFIRSGCAYLRPSGGSATLDANCEPVYVAGDPLDFRTVYYYKTGAVNVTYTNCETKSEYDINTGINNTYMLCDGSGAFNLELQNKNGEIISITKGIITLYNQRR